MWQVSWTTIVAVGVGGGLGSIARLLFTNAFNANFSHPIPFGTMFVNIIGSFIIGALFALFMSLPTSVTIKSFVITGFLGGLTTFSTFAMETVFLFNTNLFFAIANIFFNLSGSLLAAFSGYKLLGYFFK